MSGLWDAQQREWLQAMGYSVLALAGDESAAPLAEAAPARGGRDAVARPESGPRGEGARAEGARSESRRDGDAADGSPRGEAGRRSVPAAAAREGGDESALLRNLLRAARRPPGDAEVLALFDPAALRAPAAKRALWPRLRALRRGAARGPRG